MEKDKFALPNVAGGGWTIKNKNKIMMLHSRKCDRTTQKHLYV